MNERLDWTKLDWSTRLRHTSKTHRTAEAALVAPNVSPTTHSGHPHAHGWAIGVGVGVSVGICIGTSPFLGLQARCLLPYSMVGADRASGVV